MRLPLRLSAFAAALVALVCLAGTADAQATRTWVSGVLAGPGSNVRLSDTVVTNNAPGLSAMGNGNILSLGNDTVIGNTPNGEPTLLSPLK